MKKLLFILLVCFGFMFKVSASDTFYLGDHVPDIYIYMNRINKKVYRQFRMIYKSDTNELVYCIEPGATLSTGDYERFYDFESKFHLSLEKWEKIKLIAYYGYNYENHTDIKWYAITQYIIWKEVMPSNWELYFVDSNHNKVDDMYLDEINEIYELVNNHINNPEIDNLYTVNLSNKAVITGNKYLSNYTSSNGYIDGNRLYLDNLNIGMNKFKLTYKNYSAPLFYYNSNGQNIFKRGDLLKENIDFNVYVTAGKIRVNECNEDTFSYDFIGGTYEVLDQDDEVLDSFTCDTDECISSYLPVGFHKIRVKKLGYYYEENEHIYDVEVKDSEITDIDICSIPRKKTKNIVDQPEEVIEGIAEDAKIDETEVVEETPVETTEVIEEVVETPAEETTEKVSEEIVEEAVIVENIVDDSENISGIALSNNENDDNIEVIDIPYTAKTTYYKYIFLIPLLLCFVILKFKNENNS